MDHFLEMAGREFFWMVFGTVMIVWILVAAVTKVLTTAARERSRREIAAYIAEGSITPEQGERLMRADVDSASGRHA